MVIMTSPIHEETLDPELGIGVSMSVRHDSLDTGDADLYWHLYSGYADHPAAGRMLLTAIIGESPLVEPPEDPNGLPYVATFDHEPTQDEIDVYIPEEYKR